MQRAFEPFPTISIVVPVDLKLTDFTVRSHASCARVPVAYIKLNKTDIADMQCWVFRMAQSKWKMSPSDCAELFKKYDILGFIADCYDILHLNSYECALHDVETLLKNRGVTV